MMRRRKNRDSYTKEGACGRRGAAFMRRPGRRQGGWSGMQRMGESVSLGSHDDRASNRSRDERHGLFPAERCPQISTRDTESGGEF